MSLPLNTIAACTNPPLRPPLFRGVGGMSLVLLHTPGFFSYPRPLSKGEGWRGWPLPSFFIPPGFAVPLWERGRRADAVGLSPLFSYPRLRRTPLKKGMGGLTRLVSYFGWGGWRGWAFALDAIVVCSDPPPRPPLFRGVGGMSHSLVAIAVCSDPLLRPPLFRGVGGMSHSLAFVHTPFYFHTPGPFQKGRAGAVLVFH